MLGIKWYQYVRNDDVIRTTRRLNLLTVVQVWRFSLFGHRRNRCQEDLICLLLLGELEETSRTLSYYVDEDYPARPEVQ